MNITKPVSKHRFCLMGCLALLILVFGAISALADRPHMALSKDGTPISYEVYGKGEPTLVFVHGWSCDARYWQAQIPAFSRKHRVVVLDLAGHGHSGANRLIYSMAAFGEDVKAVTDAVGAGNVILIGHSMGGAVIAESARLMPERVVGLIGVDTFDNVEYPLTREDFAAMLAPLEKNFRAGTREFVKEMILPKTDPALQAWILADMSSAPPAVALSAMNEMLTQYLTGEAANVFGSVRVPVVSVNGSLWPINVDGNRRHMASFEAIILPEADHFLMMDQPEAFNGVLEKAIQLVVAKSGPATSLELKKTNPQNSRKAAQTP